MDCCCLCASFSCDQFISHEFSDFTGVIWDEVTGKLYPYHLCDIGTSTPCEVPLPTANFKLNIQDKNNLFASLDLEYYFNI